MAEASTSALPRLSVSALESFTASHARAPNAKIAAFLKEQRTQSYKPELLPDRASVPPTPALPASPPARRRFVERVEDDFGWDAHAAERKRGAALQLVTEDERDRERQRLERLKAMKDRKPSVVSQMQPRTKPRPQAGSASIAVFADKTTTTNPKKATKNVTSSSHTALLVSNRKTTVDKGKAKAVEVVNSDGSTFGRIVKGTSGPPPLKSKTKTKEDDKSNKENIAPLKTTVLNAPKKRGRPAGKKNDTGLEPDAILTKRTRSGKVDEGRSGTSEVDDEASVEVATRLGARRERRRVKASYRRDPNQSLTQAAAAEGSRVKQARKQKRKEEARKEEANSSDTSSSSPSEARRKKNKKSKRDRRDRQLHDSGYTRPSNVTKNRLSLPAPRQVGMFANGYASKKVRRSRVAAPELIFTNLNFLNQPSSSTTSSTSRSSTTKRPAQPAPGPRPPSRHRKDQPEHTALKQLPHAVKDHVKQLLNSRPSSRSTNYDEIVRVAVEAAIAAAVKAIQPQDQPQQQPSPPPRPQEPLAPTRSTRSPFGQHTKPTVAKPMVVSDGHSAYSVQQREAQPARNSAVVSTSRSRPRTISAALPDSSLARLSAQRGLSEVRAGTALVMDTTQAAWNVPPVRVAPVQHDAPPPVAHQPTESDWVALADEHRTENTLPLERPHTRRMSVHPFSAVESHAPSASAPEREGPWSDPTAYDAAHFDEFGMPTLFEDDEMLYSDEMLPSEEEAEWAETDQCGAFSSAGQQSTYIDESFVYADANDEGSLSVPVGDAWTTYSVSGGGQLGAYAGAVGGFSTSCDDYSAMLPPPEEEEDPVPEAGYCSEEEEMNGFDDDYVESNEEDNAFGLYWDPLGG